MAFQPIVNVETGSVFAYEALVRGVNGEGAGAILSQVTEQNRYAFDQKCRVKAITLAAKLGLVQTGAMLSINFMPGAVYSPSSCIKLTLQTAQSVGFPMDKLIFELTEAEEVADREHLRGIIDEYHKFGFKMALDDFGAGFSGVNLLADMPMDIIKMDMDMTRNLGDRPTALIIVRSLVSLAKQLGQVIIAEGIETIDEYVVLRDCGVNLMQGYLFAKPAFEALPEVKFVEARAKAA